VLEATVAALHAPAQQLQAWLGPAAGPQAYEIGEEVHAAFVGHSPVAESAFTATRLGHWRWTCTRWRGSGWWRQGCCRSASTAAACAPSPTRPGSSRIAAIAAAGAWPRWSGAIHNAAAAAQSASSAAR
jgi:hypothetical protein